MDNLDNNLRDFDELDELGDDDGRHVRVRGENNVTLMLAGGAALGLVGVARTIAGVFDPTAYGLMAAGGALIGTAVVKIARI